MEDRNVMKILALDLLILGKRFWHIWPKKNLEKLRMRCSNVASIYKVVPPSYFYNYQSNYS